MSVAPVRTVVEVLSRFDAEFREFSTAFSEGQYVLWLGSGISRDRVPGVSELLERVLEHLRSHVVDGDLNCIYQTALNEVLRIAGITTDERSALNLEETVSEWPLRQRIVSALVTNYSKVLDVLVGDDNPEDYLVWTALDAANTYGSPDLEPDVEHYCIAILMLEGIVDSAVTANWDGLLESAFENLTSVSSALLKVAVRPEDFRHHRARIELIKFHGCAVLAREQEINYRALLVARESQISTWTQQPENKSMRKHLELLYTDRLTLMIGLSAQDANLHTVFASAIQNYARTWPALPPAVVLSEESLESHHRHLLRITYANDHPGNGAEIAASALLGSYAKPTLLALVISSLFGKIEFLLNRRLVVVWNQSSLGQAQSNLTWLREKVAVAADLNHPERQVRTEYQREYLKNFIEFVKLVLTVFRTGMMPAPTEVDYQPLSDVPIQQAVLNADFPSSQFGLLGLAASLIVRGQSQAIWTAHFGSAGEPEGGVVSLHAINRKLSVFLVKDVFAATKLEMDEIIAVSTSDSLVVTADEEALAQTRSPRSRFGRVGRSETGRFSLASSLNETNSFEDLFEAFRLSGGY